MTGLLGQFHGLFGRLYAGRDTQSSLPSSSQEAPRFARLPPPPPLQDQTGHMGEPLSLGVPDATPLPLPIGEQSARRRIFQAFDASMPVENRHGLSGRGRELARLVDGVLDQGKHAILFGARGSGKTSLARVFGDLADEQRLVVIYNSCGGEIDFSNLCRPYVKELAELVPEVTLNPGFARLMQAPFDARALGIFLTEVIDRPTIIIIDEFDRITDGHAKQEIAGLMKMLSDTRSQVRVVLVGIAANLEDLLTGHPSLRRHMVSLPIGGISASNLEDLLRFCCNRAGITIDPVAVDLVVQSAMGSPFHLRLFGLQCALAAQRSNDGHIEETVAHEGLSDALQDWSQFAPELVGHYYQLLHTGDAAAVGIAAACVLACYNTQFGEGDVREALVRVATLNDSDAQRIAANVMHCLMPALQATGSAGRFMFADSLAPQFFLLIHRGTEFAIDDRTSVSALFNKDVQLQLDAMGQSQ